MNATPFITEIARQSILIDGKCYTAQETQIPEGESQSLLQKRFHAEYGADSFQASLADFLAEWFDDSTTVLVHTSGSTGTPKPLRVEKQRMMQSAMLTVSFLGLKQGDTALLCMPLKHCRKNGGRPCVGSRPEPVTCYSLRTSVGRDKYCS